MTAPVVSLISYDPGKLIDRMTESIIADKGKNIVIGEPSDFTTADGKTNGKLYLIKWDYPTTPLITLVFAIERPSGKCLYVQYTNVASWYKEADAKAILSSIVMK